MHDPRAAVSAACCCCEEAAEEEEGEEGSLLPLSLLSFPPPPALSSLTSNSSGQFFPVMNSLALRASGGAVGSSSREDGAPSSTAMPFKTSICPCGLEEKGVEDEAAAARALGLRSGASTHPTTEPVEGSMRATQGVPQTFAQSSPSDREASPIPFGFLPPPRLPKSEEGGALAVSFEAVAAEEGEETPEEEESRDLTALDGTHSSSLRLKTSTLFPASSPLPLPPPAAPPSTSVTVIVLTDLETFEASAKVILEEPSERATAEAWGTKAAPQPSPSCVLVSSEICLSEEAEELFFDEPAPVRRCKASSMAPPSASAGFFGLLLSLSVELRSASASCQKALPESQVSWRSLEGDEEEEVEAFFLLSKLLATFVSPSPKASSGSLAVLRALPDSRSTSLTVDLPLRPVG